MRRRGVFGFWLGGGLAVFAGCGGLEVGLDVAGAGRGGSAGAGGGGSGGAASVEGGAAGSGGALAFGGSDSGASSQAGKAGEAGNGGSAGAGGSLGGGGGAGESGAGGACDPTPLAEEQRACLAGPPGIAVCRVTDGTKWSGCRGTGCDVCLELLVEYPYYLQNHPCCIGNPRCDELFTPCNPLCPEPTEADKLPKCK